MKTSLLWEIYKDGSSKRSFLMGTMHVRSKDVFTALNLIKALIDNVAVYYGEMDLNDPELQTLQEDHMMLDEFLTSHLYAPKVYQKMRRAILAAFDIDIMAFDRYKPLVIANIIAESILTQEYQLSLDAYLWQYGLETHKKMRGLESVAEQGRIMSSIPIEFQLKSLRDIAKNTPKFKQSVIKLASKYADGNIIELYKSSKKSMGELRSLLIYDRNINMASKLIQALDDNEVFFAAVGAAHLAGDKGILALLKKEGYRVKPIRIEA